MKLRIAGAAVSSGYEQAFRNMMMKALQRETVVLSQPKIEALSRKLQVVAEEEAERLFTVLADIIDEPTDTMGSPKLTYQQLMEGARGDISNVIPRYVSQAPVAWKPLSADYYERKFKYYRNADNMFVYFGDLRRYFTRYSESIVRNRLGGVKVSISTSGIEAGDYFNRGQNGYDRILLDNLTVEIFPNLSASLLSMMSGKQWNDLNGQVGAFEDELFAGTEVARKLVNRGTGYRGLVMPAVQFWIQVRIPAVIFRTLRDFTQRSALRNRS